MEKLVSVPFRGLIRFNPVKAGIGTYITAFPSPFGVL